MTINRYILKTVFSIVLLLSLFLGATYAWFTDSATNQGNRIQAGNLKVKFEASETVDGIYRDISGTADPIFDFGTNAQPGDGPFVVYIKVTSIGSILLSYQIDFDILEDDLEEVVFFKIEKVTYVGETNNYTTNTIDGLLLGNEKLEGFNLIKDAFEVYKITMSFDADNEYNLDDLTDPLSFLFDIRLYAYQASKPEPFPV